MEPTRPAGCYGFCDTSLGWPGGSSRGRSASRKGPPPRGALTLIACAKGECTMSSILVHLTHGPEHPTRAALAFRVAKLALDEGHKVTMFLAGDAVQLIRDAVLDNLVGLGTGNLRELYDAVAASGSKIYISRLSSKPRGVDAQA